MIKVKLDYEWQPASGRGVTLTPALFRVLYAVHETGLLAEAARRVGMSYRHIWGQMGRWEKLFGRPLVVLRKGQGASLTEFGRKLLWADQLVQARLAPELESVRHQIEQALAHRPEGDPRVMSICASHDLALAELRDRLTHRKGLQLGVRFMGSMESLAALGKDQCALAGFHVSEGGTREATAPFRRLLEPRRHALIGFATRTQGLMVARENPKAIAGISDLGRPGLRIVNRQPGSGSRLEFDELLAAAGIDGRTLDGYNNEEFTHLAVAATVASGMADAGYGIRAAAERFGLDFIPLLTERYYLACRRDALHTPAMTEVLDLLGSVEFAEIIAGLPGYGAEITGRTYRVGDAFRPAPRRKSYPARPRGETQTSARAVASSR